MDALDYQGPALDDEDLLADLPLDLCEVLRACNGFVQFGGGLHVRGACRGPDWHSLRAAMEGGQAFHLLYPDVVDPTDIPFGQDCMGDQFVLRGGEVHQLAAEVGEMDSLGMGLVEFLGYLREDPVERLCLHPLREFQERGGGLAPGRLLLAYPPFCTGQSGAGASIKDAPAQEVIGFHADLARRIGELGDGEEFVFQLGQ